MTGFEEFFERTLFGLEGVVDIEPEDKGLCYHFWQAALQEAVEAIRKDKARQKSDLVAMGMDRAEHIVRELGEVRDEV